MLSWVSTQTTWFLVSRTASNILVSTTPDEWFALHTWHLQPADQREVSDALFTQRKAVGPYLIIGCWDAGCDEPLASVGRLEPDVRDHDLSGVEAARSDV